MISFAPAPKVLKKFAPRIAGRFLFTIIFISTVTLAPRALVAQGSSVRAETFPLGANGQVQISNARGATRVQSWDNNSVRVVAEKKTPAGSALEPADLMLMGAQGSLFVECKNSARGGRVDLTVYAPRYAALQVTGGAWAVEATGPFASTIIETTTGSISLRMPSNDNARVSLRTSSGIAKSTVPLVVSDKAGNRMIEGTLGEGGSDIILVSQAGNITLAPGPAVPSMIARRATTVDASYPASSDQPSLPSQQHSSNQDPSRNQAGSQGPVYRPSSIPGPRHSGGATYDEPTQSGGQSSGQTGGGSVVFAGNDRSDDVNESYTAGGPFSRPRIERNTSNGNSGLRVRIIPSTTPLGSPRDTGGQVNDNAQDDPRSNRQSSGGVFPDNDARQQSGSGGYNNQTRGNAGNQPSGPYGPRRTPGGRDDIFNESPESPAAGNRSSAPPTLGRRDDSDDVPAGVSREEAPDGDTITLDSALVNLNVSVMNRSGGAIANLKKEDFQIQENGTPQSVEFFQTGTAPFNLVLALDLSGSIKDKLDVVKSAALKFIDVLGSQDRVAVLTFTDEVRVISQLTQDRKELRRRIREIERPDGATAFYEAMWFALADTLKGTAGQRNAIVVMTDGVDSSLDRYSPAPTRVSFTQLTRRLEESDVIMFPIYLDTEYEEVFERMNSSSEVYAIARDQLERLAEVSGGHTFRAEKAGDLSGVYKQVAGLIRTVYSVGYYPTNAERDGKFRRVRVSVSRPEAAVRTRKGYYAK
ncbi:MAG TPA: VWA domain-containing protein [Blastocatellia bacterium]|jgi:VWFA-related protein